MALNILGWIQLISGVIIILTTILFLLALLWLWLKNNRVSNSEEIIHEINEEEEYQDNDGLMPVYVPEK